jgi:hypothetical protein
MAKEEVKTRVITGKVRFSYAHVWEPYEVAAGQTAKYSVCLLIPKTDKATVKKINDAVDAAIEAGKTKLAGKNGTVNKKALKMPLRDGDEERSDDDAYKGMYFINANSTTAPGVVDLQLNPIIDKTEFYSGCYGRASVNFYAFNTNGNKGVACGLNNLQKLADGEPFANIAKAEDDFNDDFDYEDEFEDDEDLLG